MCMRISVVCMRISVECMCISVVCMCMRMCGVVLINIDNYANAESYLFGPAEQLPRRTAAILGRRTVSSKLSVRQVNVHLVYVLTPIVTLPVYVITADNLY